MRDQASKLRNLVSQTHRNPQQHVPPPKMIATLGGQGEVGTTTVAVNLAVAMSLQGARVVLVDGGMYRPDVATMCGLSERRTVADVLASGNDIHEVLQRGPGGISVVPGLWAPGADNESLQAKQLRLIEQFRGLGRHADYVVVDAGSGGSPTKKSAADKATVRKFSEVADEVLLVTTPDSAAVMDTYATVKTLLAPLGTTPISLLVNKAESAEDAEDVELRICRSCKHFLDLEIDVVGWIPVTSKLRYCKQQQQPLVIDNAQSAAAVAILEIAGRLSQRLVSERRASAA